jgi:hypothetical protein
LAHLVARIFQGDLPEKLPIKSSTRFEFAINLKTAQNLGLTVPPALLAHADEVIDADVCPLLADAAEKVFWDNKRDFLKRLMRFVRSDARNQAAIPA